MGATALPPQYGTVNRPGLLEAQFATRIGQAGFDSRFLTGPHRPSRDNVVTARDLGGFVKPPTKQCHAPNLVTLSGAIAPAPPGLPTFKRQPSLVPWCGVTMPPSTRSGGPGVLME